MKMVKVMQLVGMSAAVALLSACTHSKVASDSSDTSAYGTGGDNGYQTTGTEGATGMHVNSLTAPSNQTYYFDFDSNTVHSSDSKAMTIQANYLAAHPKATIRLEGNTDNRGSREYNVGLGWRRDQAVARYFEQHGVSAQQIQMVSYGKEHPVAFGNSANAWSLNRRVDLVYKTKS